MLSIKPDTLINSLPQLYARIYRLLLKYDANIDSPDIKIFNSFNNNVAIEYLDGDSIKGAIDMYKEYGDRNYLIEAVVMIAMLDAKHELEIGSAMN